MCFDILSILYVLHLLGYLYKGREQVEERHRHRYEVNVIAALVSQLLHHFQNVGFPLEIQEWGLVFACVMQVYKTHS